MGGVKNDRRGRQNPGVTPLSEGEAMGDRLKLEQATLIVDSIGCEPQGAGRVGWMEVIGGSDDTYQPRNKSPCTSLKTRLWPTHDKSHDIIR